MCINTWKGYRLQVTAQDVVGPIYIRVHDGIIRVSFLLHCYFSCYSDGPQESLIASQSGWKIPLLPPNILLRCHHSRCDVQWRR